LEVAKLTQEIIDAFAEKGAYLTYNIDAEDKIVPEGSAFITVVTPNQAWRVTDPNQNNIWDVLKQNGVLETYKLINDVRVDVVGRNQRWVIYDLNAANAYLVLADPAKKSDLDIYDYLSYMPLHDSQGMTYVDMAIEAKGYIYVLSHKDTGGVINNTDYALDIYNPDGSFLVRCPDPKLHTSGNMQYVSAARIALDVFRNLFTLNYSTFAGPGGRTEPSISQWMPTPPLFDVDNNKSNFDVFKNGDMAKIRTIFADHKITLSGAATITTLSPEGHWSIVDGQNRYDVIASVDKIYVYDISA